jgi:hypothetical protein
MRNNLIFILLFPLTSFSQVGIGTDTPTRSLDVNGTFRLRNTTSVTRESAAKDSVLVVDRFGNVDRVTSKSIIESHFKSFVRGNYGTSGTTDIAVSSSLGLMKFPSKDFDLTNDYSSASGFFTAKISGIYHVSVSVKFAPAVLALSGDVGVAIRKTTGGVTTTKAKSSFSNIAVLTINVTPPARYTETIVELLAGDTVSFSVIGASTITVVNDETFFSIEQVR